MIILEAMSAADFKRWRNENIVYNFDTSEFLTVDERREKVIEELNFDLDEDEIDEDIINETILEDKSYFGYLYDEYFNDYDEVDYKFFLPEYGNEIVLIGKYLND